MPGGSYGQRPEVEAQFVGIELSKRRIALAKLRLALLGQAVLLVLTVAAVPATVVCALHGTFWPLATAAGGLVAVTGRLCDR